MLQSENTSYVDQKELSPLESSVNAANVFNPEAGNSMHLERNCKKVSAILLRENRFVSVSNIQLWAGLAHEEAVPALRSLFQSGCLDHIPGNGTGNSRYRLRVKEAHIPALSVALPDQTDQEDSVVLAIIEPVKAAQTKHEASATAKVNVKAEVAREKAKSFAVPVMPSAAMKIHPPAWANPFPEPLSIEGLGTVKSRFVFHFSRRPGGINIAMHAKHARFIANCILEGAPSLKEPALPGNAKDTGCERVTSIGGLTIVRLTRRPGGDCMVMRKSQARDLAMQILALR